MGIIPVEDDISSPRLSSWGKKAVPLTESPILLTSSEED